MTRTAGSPAARPSATRCGHVAERSFNRRHVTVALPDLPLHQRRVADEVGNEAVGRTAVDGLRVGLLGNASLVHHHHDVGQREGFFLVVRHIDEGDAEAPLQRLQLDLEMTAHLPIESR